MSQVLKFGIPHGDNLLCDNPVCQEKATHIIKTFAPNGEGTEHCACAEHFTAMLKGYLQVKGTRFWKLRIAGERNTERPSEAGPEETKS